MVLANISLEAQYAGYVQRDTYLLNLVAVVYVYVTAVHRAVQLLELTEVFPRGAFRVDVVFVATKMQKRHRHCPVHSLHHLLPVAQRSKFAEPTLELATTTAKA